MSLQTVFRWNDDRAQDRALLEVLQPYRSRSRGPKLRELAFLGLMAERAGLRIENDQLVGMPVPSAASMALTPLAVEAVVQAPAARGAAVGALDAETVSAGLELLEGLGLTFS